jgi:hypothetical protein
MVWTTEAPGHRQSSHSARRIGLIHLAWALTLTTLAAGVTAPPTVTATGTAVSPTERTRVRVEALATLRDGPTGTWRSNLTRLLGPGEEMTVYAAAGLVRGSGLCDVSTTEEHPGGLPLALWQITVRLIATSPSRTTLGISWTRSTRGSPAAAADARIVTLAGGEEHIVDVARNDEPGAACVNFVVRLVAEPLDRSVLTGSLFAYDVWLVHRSKQGHEIIRYREMVGPPDVDLPFYFRPLDWLPNGQPVETDERAQELIRLAVAGSLRATRTRDGAVEIAVQVKRVVASGGRTAWGDGKANLRLTPGETVVFTLPQLNGQVGAIDAGRFFEGAQISLYVRIRADSSRRQP